MDNNFFLKDEFLYATEFNKINQNLANWDYTEVSGECCCKKYTGKFAYVKIKLSKIDEFSHQFLNNLTEDEMPIPFFNEIIKSLSFFISYLYGIKGKRQGLKIELIDGTYHYTDSNPKDFEAATFYAICDCFDKTLRQISENDLQVIENYKISNRK